VWSVWSESVDVYLGQGIAMLKPKRQATQVVQILTALPLADLLAKLAEAMSKPRSAANKSSPNLKITLSGALCPVFTFDAPAEVTRWHELKQIAKATAVSESGSGADQVICEIDSDRPGIASTIASPLMDELQSWAKAHHWHIASVSPLWALATQCPLARRASVSGLQMQEPDSVTLVAKDENGKVVASTFAGEPSLASVQAQARRWMVSHSVLGDNLLKLNFGIQSSSMLANAPKAWAAHWGKL
jgi:hypothetical protein